MSTHLCHYTNADGLFGIVESRAFWASKSRLMNDPSEIVFARDRINEAAKRFTLETDQAFWDAVFGEIDAMMTYDDIYLVSFSHDPDVLSMWNRYGKKAGYSLCFDTKVLRGQVESAADDIFPGQFEVLYAADVQQKLIHAELQNLATEYRKGNLLLGKVPEKDVRNSILRMLFSLKHPCYSDESESRYAFAIANPLGTCSKNYAEKTRFRVKAGRFYPFTEIKFDPRTVLKQVHLSPGLSLRDTEGLDMFLYKHVGGIPILESKLPYVDR